MNNAISYLSTRLWYTWSGDWSWCGGLAWAWSHCWLPYLAIRIPCRGRNYRHQWVSLSSKINQFHVTQHPNFSPLTFFFSPFFLSHWSSSIRFSFLFFFLFALPLLLIITIATIVCLRVPVIALCCIFRCRIPRTKQEIEADHHRKKITKAFREHLNKIPMEELEFEKGTLTHLSLLPSTLTCLLALVSLQSCKLNLLMRPAWASMCLCALVFSISHTFERMSNGCVIWAHFHDCLIPFHPFTHTLSWSVTALVKVKEMVDTKQEVRKEKLTFMDKFKQLFSKPKEAKTVSKDESMSKEESVESRDEVKEIKDEENIERWWPQAHGIHTALMIMMMIMMLQVENQIMKDLTLLVNYFPTLYLNESQSRSQSEKWLTTNSIVHTHTQCNVTVTETGFNHLFYCDAEGKLLNQRKLITWKWHISVSLVTISSNWS